MDHFQNADQKKIFIRSWKPTCDPVAVLLITHGVSEHSGKYESLATFLIEHKYAVYSHDHVGHGNSDGERAHVEDFQIYVRDVIQHIGIIKQTHANIPLFLFGHSMSGTIAALLAIQNPEILDGVIFSSPSILHPRGAMVRGLVHLVSYFTPQLRLTNSDPSKLSRDPDEVRACLEDPLTWHGGMKAVWVSALFSAQTQIANGVSRITLPFITIHGTDDQLVDIASSQFLYDNAQSKDKTFEKFKDGRHKLLIDLERDRYKQVILDWLNKHITS